MTGILNKSNRQILDIQRVPGCNHVQVVTTLRNFGDMARQKNGYPPNALTGRLANILGLEKYRFRWMKQVHGNRVVHEKTAGLTNNADGCVTTVSNLGIGILTADCLPVMIAVSKKRAVAALHAGWRGLAFGIIDKGLKKICRITQSHPRNAGVAIGPGIRQCCYEVDDEVRDTFIKNYGSSVGRYFRQNGTHYLANLAGIAVCQLKNLGVRPDRISISKKCTSCMKSRYFSYRARKESGRMATIICAPFSVS